MILFYCILLQWELLLKERICSQFSFMSTVPYSMEIQFYHIKWPPLNVTNFYYAFG